MKRADHANLGAIARGFGAQGGGPMPDPHQLVLAFVSDLTSQPKRPRHRVVSRPTQGSQLTFAWPSVDAEIVAAVEDANRRRSGGRIAVNDLLWAIAAIQAAGRVWSRGRPTYAATLATVCRSLQRTNRDTVGRMLRRLADEGLVAIGETIPSTGPGRPTRLVRLTEEGRARLEVERLSLLAAWETEHAREQTKARRARA